MTRQWNVLAMLLVVMAFLVAACGGREETDPAASGQGPGPTRTSETNVTSATSDASPEAAGLPRPDDSGLCRGLSFDEAQQLTRFELVRPTAVPASLTFDGIVVEAPFSLEPAATPASSCDGSDFAMLYFTPKQGQGNGVQLTETTRFKFDARQPKGDIVSIGGISVDKTTTINPAGDTVSTYTWDRRGVTMQLVGITDAVITQRDLEQVIAAMPPA